MPHTRSPLRYPGGKTSMYPMVSDAVSASGARTFAEPFCGGAGLSLKLLLSGDVESVWINDMDPAVYAMWHAFLHDADAMCEFVEAVPVDMATWRGCRAVVDSASGSGPRPDLDLARAALFLNRTNRSGILRGGVVGGKAQDGPYKLGARFTRSTLVGKIRAVASNADRIRLTGVDGASIVRSASDPSLFLFCDPPYVAKGPGLYGVSFDEADHVALRDALARTPCPWMLTYDDHPLVRGLYEGFDSTVRGKWYTAQSRGVVGELVVRGGASAT